MSVLWEALKVCLFFLADVQTGFGDSGSTDSIVRLLLRVCEAMAGVFWGVVGGLKVGIGIRAIQSIFDTSRVTTFGGVFAANPALSLI